MASRCQGRNPGRPNRSRSAASRSAVGEGIVIDSVLVSSMACSRLPIGRGPPAVATKRVGAADQDGREPRSRIADGASTSSHQASNDAETPRYRRLSRSPGSGTSVTSVASFR